MKDIYVTLSVGTVKNIRTANWEEQTREYIKGEKAREETIHKESSNGKRSWLNEYAVQQFKQQISSPLCLPSRFLLMSLWSLQVMVPLLDGCHHVRDPERVWISQFHLVQCWFSFGFCGFFILSFYLSTSKIKERERERSSFLRFCFLFTKE